MKKTLILIITGILLSSFGFTTVLTVGRPGNHENNFDTIQEAVNFAVDGDEIEVYEGNYFESVNLDNFSGNNLIIRSTYPEQSNIVYATQVISSVTNNGCFYKFDNSSVTKVFIINGLHLWGYDGINTTDNNIEIHFLNCKIDNMLNYGIKMVNSEKLLEIENCYIDAGPAGIVHLLQNQSYVLEPITTIENSIIISDGYGVNGYSIGGYPNIRNRIEINRSTIADCGIYGISGVDIEIHNSIVYCDTSYHYTGEMTATYSDIKGGFVGEGNIDSDPLFCDYGYQNYHLLEGSPCIDTGNPSLSDADGTRLDMGCYASTTDIKPLVGNHWNWVSFPRLERANNEPVNAPDLLEEMLPSLPDNLHLKGSENDLTYDPLYLWVPSNYSVRSTDSYKLNPEEDGDYILPEEGSRLNPGYTITLSPTRSNWVGYWIPYTQNYLDALGDQIEHITYIKAEDWYLYKKHGEWYGMIGPNGATFVYGKGYEIGVDEQISFSWAKVKSSEPFEKGATEYFSYEDQPNYEMIEIESVEGGEDVLEIGVFQGEVCIGASKVEGYPVHLMAYTTAANREDELNFEIVTGRGKPQKIQSVWKYNFKSGEYEPVIMHGYDGMFSLIKLDLSGNANPPENDSEIFLSNYPNPFKPQTTISFMLEGSAEVRLSVFNLKGQKVKTLLKGKVNKGNQEIIWNGTDDKGKQLAAGIYLYRLETPTKTVNRKMILLK